MYPEAIIIPIFIIVAMIMLSTFLYCCLVNRRKIPQTRPHTTRSNCNNYSNRKRNDYNDDIFIDQQDCYRTCAEVCTCNRATCITCKTHLCNPGHNNDSGNHCNTHLTSNDDNGFASQKDNCHHHNNSNHQNICDSGYNTSNYISAHHSTNYSNDTWHHNSGHHGANDNNYTSHNVSGHFGSNSHHISHYDSGNHSSHDSHHTSHHDSGGGCDSGGGGDSGGGCDSGGGGDTGGGCDSGGGDSGGGCND